MSKVQMLTVLMKQRLTAAAEEIFGLFERTIAEYEEELSRSKASEGQQKLLDAVFRPQLRLHRADVQQLLVVKEEVPPEQQEWSSSLDTEPPHIIEEQEELWTSQEGEQLRGLEEADITKFTFTPVPVKSDDDDDEEKLQCSQFYQRLTEQMETEADGENCGGPEPARNSDPDKHPEPDTVDKTGDSSESEMDDRDDWRETREHQSGLNFLNNGEVPVSDSRCSADVQQLLVVKEEVPPEQQQEWSSSLDQEDPEPPHIKEEQEEFYTSQEGGQLQGLEEADITKFTFTPVPVKSEDDEKKPQSSQLHQRLTELMETEPDGEDGGGPEPARNSDPDKHPEADSVDKTGDSSEPEMDDRDDWKETNEPQSRAESSQLHQTQIEKNREAEASVSSSTEQMETEADVEDCGGPEPTRNSDPDRHLQPITVEMDDSDDWKETREPQSGLNSLKNDEVPVRDSRCSAGEKLKVHTRSHTGEKPFSCSVCGKQFTQKIHLTCHMVQHSGGKQFSCSAYDERFGFKGNLKKHIRTHRGEKPFSCTVSKKSFTQSGVLQQHMRIHTGEKFSCSVCSKASINSSVLKKHMTYHMIEKPFSCSLCKKSFKRSDYLQRHVRIHTGEKPFSCSVCGKRFIQKAHLTPHMSVHTGERLFSCSVCNKRFAWRRQVKKHKCIAQSSQLHQTQTEENREAEPPASSSTEQMETEADGEDCGEPDPARNSDPDILPGPDTDDKTGHSSEPDDGVDTEFWKNTRKHQSRFTYQRNKKVSVNDGYNTGEKPFSCSNDKTETEPKTGHSVNDDFSQQTRQPQSGPNHLNTEEVSVSDTGYNTDMKPFSSSEDDHTLLTHQGSSIGEKSFGCSVLGKTFAPHESLPSHITYHRAEKPFHCSVCTTAFSDSESLVQHMRIHTRQTQFRCRICGEEFAWRRCLTKHMKVH